MAALQQTRGALAAAFHDVGKQVIGGVLSVLILGVSIAEGTLLPIYAAIGFLGCYLAFNIFAAPMRLDEKAEVARKADEAKIEFLREQLETKRIRKQQYEALMPLFLEGQQLNLSIPQEEDGPGWAEWTERVNDWRQRAYEALPVERDGFFTICTPEYFNVLSAQGKQNLYQSQFNKFRLVMMRVENAVDAWEASSY